MRQVRISSAQATLASLLVLALAAGACSGGGGGDDDDDNETPTPTPVTRTVLVIAGATELPMAGVTVVSHDSAGNLVAETTTAADGTAQLSVPAAGSVAALYHSDDTLYVEGIHAPPAGVTPVLAIFSFAPAPTPAPTPTPPPPTDYQITIVPGGGVVESDVHVGCWTYLTATTSALITGECANATSVSAIGRDAGGVPVAWGLQTNVAPNFGGTRDVTVTEDQTSFLSIAASADYPGDWSLGATAYRNGEMLANDALGGTASGAATLKVPSGAMFDAYELSSSAVGNDYLSPYVPLFSAVRTARFAPAEVPASWALDLDQMPVPTLTRIGLFDPARTEIDIAELLPDGASITLEYSQGPLRMRINMQVPQAMTTYRLPAMPAAYSPGAMDLERLTVITQDYDAFTYDDFVAGTVDSNYDTVTVALEYVQF